MFKWIGDIFKKVVANLLTIAIVGIIGYFLFLKFFY